MNDRELLEFAAKAAGIKKDDSPNNGGGYLDNGFDMSGSMVLDWHNNKCWNPLTDDGDALRLAVKLHINVRYVWDGENDQYDTVYAERGRIREWAQIGMFKLEDIDENAATRLAIVRAAAEIGKAMP